jgi:hypothetical protein
MVDITAFGSRYRPFPSMAVGSGARGASLSAGTDAAQAVRALPRRPSYVFRRGVGSHPPFHDPASPSRCCRTDGTGQATPGTVLLASALRIYWRLASRRCGSAVSTTAGARYYAPRLRHYSSRLLMIAQTLSSCSQSISSLSRDCSARLEIEVRACSSPIAPPFDQICASSRERTRLLCGRMNRTPNKTRKMIQGDLRSGSARARRAGRRESAARTRTYRRLRAASFTLPV